MLPATYNLMLLEYCKPVEDVIHIEADCWHAAWNACTGEYYHFNGRSFITVHYGMELLCFLASPHRASRSSHHFCSPMMFLSTVYPYPTGLVLMCCAAFPLCRSRTYRSVGPMLVSAMCLLDQVSSWKGLEFWYYLWALLTLFTLGLDMVVHQDRHNHSTRETSTRLPWTE